MTCKNVSKLALVIGLLVLSVSAASAQSLDQTQDYRIWSAEQMINRLTEKFARAHNLCDRIKVKVLTPHLSDECKTSILNAYPILTTIRDVALSSDAVRWAELIDRVHKFEAEIEAPMNNLARQ